MKSYSSQLARIHIDHYLFQLLQDTPDLASVSSEAPITSESLIRYSTSLPLPPPPPPPRLFPSSSRLTVLFLRYLALDSKRIDHEECIS